MLRSRLFEDIDLARYGRIVATMLGQPAPVAVCDANGVPVWVSGGADSALAEQVSDMLRDARQDDASITDRARCHGLSSDRGIAYSALDADSGQASGWVVILLDSENHRSASFSSLALSILDEIAPLLTTELQRVRELDDMAEELGERYNELNLLCRTDVQDATQTECRDKLSQHVRECATHLGVDLAALWISSRGVMFPAGELYRSSDEATNAWLQQLADHAYQWFRDGHGRLGINQPDDPSWARLGMHAVRKIVGVPVLDGRESICGVVVCANGLDRKDFSNSDLSLLEMVAEKVSLCVRESQDELTGLLNRNGFKVHLEQLQVRVNATICKRVVCLMNLDQFKVINASYGLAAGDETLREIAALLSEKANGLGIVARFDADNFAVLLEDSSLEDAQRFADSLCSDVGQLRLSWAGKCFTPSMSAGLAAVERQINDETIADMIQAAETALTGAKEAGGNRVEVYQPDNVALVQRNQQLQWVERIKQALEENRFTLYCQRIEPLAGGELHYEILVRMLDEDGGIVAPGMFIGTAERYNLMPAVDRWVIREAMKVLAEQTRCGKRLPVSWGINLSGQSLNSPSFLEFLSEQLKSSCLPPRSIYLEITETAAVQNFHLCVEFMKAIQAIGCRFALDDFGSGLSSFAYLKNLPVDYLKIDGALVRDMINNPIDQTMVSAIAQVGKSMGLKTIAEFVEDRETMQLLNDLNVDYAQGYVIMKPAPLADELRRLMQSAEAAPDTGSTELSGCRVSEGVS